MEFRTLRRRGVDAWPYRGSAALALIDYAHAAVALQRRVRTEYIMLRRQNRLLPYIDLNAGLEGGSTREQIYRRVAFQAALADLAELTSRGFVRHRRWEDGSVRISLQAASVHQEELKAVDGDPELEASFVSTFMPEGNVWWMPIFSRGTGTPEEWRGITALRLNIAHWRELLIDLCGFFDTD